MRLNWIEARTAWEEFDGGKLGRSFSGVNLGAWLIYALDVYCSSGLDFPGYSPSSNKLFVPSISLRVPHK